MDMKQFIFYGVIWTPIPTKMKNFCVPLFALLMCSIVSRLTAQSDCDGSRYRYTSAFEEFEVTYDVEYGNAINTTGLNQSLVVDIYEPSGDDNTLRPLILLGHGGFFIGGDNAGTDVVPLAQDLSRMGYVVGSISYRLGVDNFLDISNSLIRSVWRAYHDGKAAVRFFRKTVEEEGNPWGIDPDRIYVGGVSAGAFIGLHMDYIDDESEIPSQIDQSVAGMGGGLEGESGNLGYSSEFAGVVNIGGAIKTVDFMSADGNPIVSVHGNNDQTVPYDSGLILLSGVPITEVDGSATIHETAVSFGIESCFTTIEGGGHVPHVSDANAYFQTLGTVSGALSSWLCDDYEPLCGAYDYEAVGVEEWLLATTGSWRAFPSLLGAGEPLQVQWLKARGAVASWNYQIFDANGRQVKDGIGNSDWFSVPTNHLSSGLYILRMSGVAGSQKFWVK